MTLDLRKTVSQIKTLALQDTSSSIENKVNQTYELFNKASSNSEKLLSKLLEVQESKKSAFFFASPCLADYTKETIKDISLPTPNFSASHIVIATDGSQINPSSHEFSSAALINIGMIAIPYFKSSVPVYLQSEPVVFNSVEEILSLSYSEGIQDEDLISYERTIREVEALVMLAKKYASHGLPIVALLDGTLIHWHLEKFNNIYIKHFIERFSKALNELKEMNIPVASFLSNSRSNELINMLKIFNCPYESVDCKQHCSNIDSKNLPCNPFADYKPVFDRRIIEKLFLEEKSELGAKTILFKSNSKILDLYPEDLKVSFFYINTGTEIGRVELPSYVANNEKLFSLMHDAVTLQCRLGFGYPVVLAESHLQAVVNKADREIFYDLLRQKLLKGSKNSIRISSKEFRKRVSYV